MHEKNENAALFFMQNYIYMSICILGLHASNFTLLLARAYPIVDFLTNYAFLHILLKTSQKQAVMQKCNDCKIA